MIIPMAQIAPIAPVPACWPLSLLAETGTSVRASAACYRLIKNVGVVPIVVAELKLSNVQRHVFGADLVERADNAALEDRPEALNRIRVDCADNVFMFGVSDESVLRIFTLQGVIGAQVVGREQANFVGNGLAHEAGQRVTIKAINDPRHHVAAPLDRADHGSLTGAGAASAAITLVPMLVAGLSADIRFVHLDDAHQLLKFLVLERGPDAVAHVPSRLVAAEAHVAVDLSSGDALLAGRHKVDDPEPLPQINVRVLKNGPDKVRETVSAALPTVRALPAVLHGFEGIDVQAATTRAIGAIGPAMSDKEGVTGFLGRKGRLELRDGHLHDLLGLFPGHDRVPSALALETQYHVTEHPSSGGSSPSMSEIRKHVAGTGTDVNINVTLK